MLSTVGGALLATFLAIFAAYSHMSIDQVIEEPVPFNVSPVISSLMSSPQLEMERAMKLQGAIKFKTVSADVAHASTCGCSHVDGQPEFTTQDGIADLPLAAREELLQLHEYLRLQFPLVHSRLEVKVVAKYSLRMTWHGADKSLDPVMLAAHMDVVPISQFNRAEWTHDPFGGEIKDGFIHGRGTLDFKNGVIGTLEAVELLISAGLKPTRTLILAFGHDEEVMGVSGAREIGRLLKSQGVKLHFILDEGTMIMRNALPTFTRDIALVSVAEKGFMNLKLRLASLGGHASMAPANGTIINRMINALTLLHLNPLPAKFTSPAADMLAIIASHSTSHVVKWVLGNGWVFEYCPFLLQALVKLSPPLKNFFQTTQALTMIQGGEAMNVLPNEVSAVINMRLSTDVTVEIVEKHVIDVLSRAGFMDASRPFYTPEYIGGHIVMDKASNDTSIALDPSPISPIASDGFKIISQTIKTLFPDAIVAPSLMIAGTDMKHYSELSENIYRFSPLVLTTEDVARIHGVNERIGVSAFSRYVDFFIVLISEACEVRIN